ncbi:MAG: flagellar export protein FliJ [Planctomycetota bacterium]
MTNFKFRLQPLMRLREAERDRCREELAEAYRAEQILSDRQQAIRKQIEDTRELSRRRSQPGSIAVDGLLDTHRHELGLTTELRHLLVQHETVRAEVERRREALMAANKELRVLEKLREREKEGFRREQERLDIRQQDEIALRRHRAGQGEDRS